jgi:hypothetical protein
MGDLSGSRRAGPEDGQRSVARRTIVGGRPDDGLQRSVPQGIEHVLQRAALVPAFRRKLLTDRERALDAVAEELTDTERAILLAIPTEQLERMIRGAAPMMPGRRSLLARVAGMFGVLIGGAFSLPTCSGPAPRTKGLDAVEVPKWAQPTKGMSPGDPGSKVTMGKRSDVPPARSGSRGTKGTAKGDTGQ